LKKVLILKDWNQGPLTEQRLSRLLIPQPIIILITSKLGIK